MTLYDDPHTAADTDELDVRHIPKSQRHPIFARFDALAAGESFVLVNSHNPIHLREELPATGRVLMTGAIWRAARPSGCGGSGSSVSPMSTWASCCEADASVGVSGGRHRGAVD